MGLLLLKTNDCNLIYEFNKGTTLSVKVMKLKKRPKKAVIQPLKVVLVERGSTIITHIYRSKYGNNPFCIYYLSIYTSNGRKFLN